jgi:DNA repair protein RadA/Sms
MEVVQGLKTSQNPLTSHENTHFVPLKGSEDLPHRLISGMDDFDRVCGGGLVQGSVLLIGGDPGIGKSTLLLQLLAALSLKHVCAYVSGEEGIAQVRLRAKRLGLSDAPLQLASATQLESIIQNLEAMNDLSVVVIDSIQTMTSALAESAPGTVTQVRLCCQELIHFAKKKNCVVLLVGHVTKEGTIAGPRVLEHMVDAVLSFEGQRDHHYRMLRGQKNRFGPCDELGVFEMKERGLQTVSNPSALFLPHHHDQVPGSVVFAGIEGTRPLLCEVQALVANSSLAMPRRTCVGYDAGRLSMILAVLQTRCKLNVSSKDVYLNIAGGLKVNDPSADLAIALAIVSSLRNAPLPQGLICFGEIGLAGEIRPSMHALLRLKEAKKLGFHQALCAALAEDEKSAKHLSIRVKNLDYIQHYLAQSVNTQ